VRCMGKSDGEGACDNPNYIYIYIYIYIDRYIYIYIGWHNCSYFKL